jgi:hypothetical protein
MSDLGYITNGLGGLPNYVSIVAGGSTSLLNPTPTFNSTGLLPISRLLTPQSGLNSQQLSDLQSIFTIRNTDGSVIVPTATGFTQIGNGYSLDFDPNSLQGRLTPSLNPDSLSGQYDIFGATNVYTGADVRLMIDSAVTANDGSRYAKQLLEATTITVSVHREVSPVRASGYINPKGFALGKRTIAGTLIVTQFTADILLNFLQSIMLVDGSKDSTFTKVDQLPPFNITMIFTNEAGYASQRKLLGVKFVTDGVVYSIQDMLVEQTLSWMATDFTPLMPLTFDNMYQPTSQMDRNTRRERVPTDAMQQPQTGTQTEDDIWEAAGLN